MEITKNQNIGELVAHDYRFATIFKKYGIDFCCQGNRTIDNACDDKELEVDKVLHDLNNIGGVANTASIDFKTWPLDLLADYVEKTHHRYVADKSPEVVEYLNRIVEVHGHSHPELLTIQELFLQVVDNLKEHMEDEETNLFPYIRLLEDAKRSKTQVEGPSFGSLSNIIDEMEEEHFAEGQRMEKISNLSPQYTPPADACNTYRVTYAMLKEFENDLHLHIHLENNILFPASVRLENQLKQEEEEAMF